MTFRESIVGSLPMMNGPDSRRYEGLKEHSQETKRSESPTGLGCLSSFVDSTSLFFGVFLGFNDLPCRGE